MVALMLCYHSITPCTCKDDSSASISFKIQVDLNKLPLAALVAYPLALYSAFLHRGCQRIGGS